MCLAPLPSSVGQAFQPAGSQDFPVLCSRMGDWKVALTGRLESLPYEDAKQILFLTPSGFARLSNSE
jgi:hypothetical protein